jgi:ATP-dependent DNA helicase PIF1
MVSIPSYRGPTEWHTPSRVPIVPIVPSVARWELNGKKCSRRQYALRLAYAISIHKSQGMTLDKVAIDLGMSDFCRGLSFVAISRARRITGIAFLSRIQEHRFKKIGASNKLAIDLHRRGQLQFKDV